MCLGNLKYVNKPEIVEGASTHTDIGWFDYYDIPAVVIGAGDPRKAHQTDEYISEEELINITKFIALSILTWVNTPK